MRSSTIIGGTSPNHARHEDNFYATPPDVTRAFLSSPAWAMFEFRPLWEPACGDGAISKVLTGAGCNVASTDLHYRGYGMGGVDFLKHDMPGRAIITNPPFDAIAAQFIAKARATGMPFAMVLKGTYWHAASRQALFRGTGPRYVMPLLWRPNMVPERGKSPTMEFMWTVWDASPAPRCEYLPLPKP
jgi:hypothetical protein